MEITQKLKKIPVEVNDSPGFVSNRVLMPMINEAVFTLYEGVAGVEQIDSVMKFGMSHPMGPLQLADFIGLDVCVSIMNVLTEGLSSPKFAPCVLLKKLVDGGHFLLDVSDLVEQLGLDFFQPPPLGRWRRGASVCAARSVHTT